MTYYLYSSNSRIAWRPAPRPRPNPEVAVDDGHRGVGHRPCEVLAAAADEVVEDPDLGRPERRHLIRDMGADQTGAARDQNPLAAQVR